MIIKVGLAQISSGADPVANLEQVEDRLAEAVAQGAELVIFPEATMRCFGRSLTEVAEPLDGPWASRIRALAEQAGVVVVAGMFTPAPDGRVANTLLVCGPVVKASYDKVHLFDAFGFTESATVAPGSGPVTVPVAGTRIGLATCYDVRFPGLFTAMADDGAELIVVAASWGAGPGKVEHWDLLTRARALDATSFVVAVGQAAPPRGSDGERFAVSAPTGIGHSRVVAPDGRVVVDLGPEPGLQVVELDLAEVATVRRQLPVLANRRY